jgi:RNA-binding protein Musashi
MLLILENLQRYFSRYGEVIDCVVMKNSESGRSRGFGFVTFSDPANVSLVLQNGPHQLDGRTVRSTVFSFVSDMISSLFEIVQGDGKIVCFCGAYSNDQFNGL